VLITICGARGSIPSPGPATLRYGGETSCVAIGEPGAPPSLILDAGTGLRGLARTLDGQAFRGAIVLTHLHWDHTHGLPFFGPGDRAGAAVELLLPEQGVPARELLGRAMSPPHFPIGPGGLKGEWSFSGYGEGEIELGGYRVTAREVPHGGGRTMGLRVSDGRRSLAFIPDHGPHMAGEGEGGLGEMHPAALELCRGADLLVHDAQFTAGEAGAARALGHATVDYAVRLAERCDAGRLLLFHHDPGRPDDALDAIVERARASSSLAVDAAAEGTRVAL
jgi:phosphoribosyl 1,2-cyclic phosphodiesterase